MVLPKYSWWSISIGVITETIGVKTFVASQLPPIPTSKETASTGVSAKETNDIAVNTSKKVKGDPVICSSTKPRNGSTC